MLVAAIQPLYFYGMMHVIMRKFKIEYKKIEQYAPAAITILLLIAVIYFTQYYATPEQLEGFISKLGPWGVMAYIVAVMLANVAAPISASPFLFLGFSFYGTNAVWLFALGNIMAMAVNFYISRKFGRVLLQRLVGKSGMSKIDELSQDYGLFALFIVRMFFSGISDLASYAFGLGPIKFRPYMIVSIIGSLPPMFILYSIASPEQSPIQFLLLQLAIAGLLSGIYLAYRYIKARFLRLLLKGTL